MAGSPFLSGDGLHLTQSGPFLVSCAVLASRVGLVVASPCVHMFCVDYRGLGLNDEPRTLWSNVSQSTQGWVGRVSLANLSFLVEFCPILCNMVSEPKYSGMCRLCVLGQHAVGAANKQCNSFKTRAIQVKNGLESGLSGVNVLVNPEKDMKRPFTPMKALDMDKVISDIIDKIK
ncbi:hypothetical protein TEA_001881 [Camellia sinensis var. sinensis]|uniref:Uncharacterized protein n=1 Tax=Camellia sinensis var. sinensis TaxID=542762 RepID=A0A4S4DVF3_CAMSN|nr:hypothetical protein TEA_001881 [Camellia sinensis var. sinensis]